MIGSIARKIFGTRNGRLLKQYRNMVTQINDLEPEIAALTDAALAETFAGLKQQVATGIEPINILPKSFALTREAAKRCLSMRHFDVQLLGGITLFFGKVAEMSTGEGKTLVATLPACLGALTGNSVHIITVNDYLAQRDAEWMRPVYKLLGLSVGIITSNMPLEARKNAYACDIVYGTNNEFGFDYLRDNMIFSKEQQVQSKLSFAIIDEVDSILIDEARTPLIISGPAEDSSDLYIKINSLVANLTKPSATDSGDFTLDEKTKQAYLTEQGHQKVEELLVENGLLESGESLYEPGKLIFVHHIYASLRAHFMYNKDIDYLVKDNQVMIVDEHTGRSMPGRRWSDGLHQAIEAKEKLPVQAENQTLASITFQNYFRLYDKIAGMTGTAETEAYELQQIYNLEVVVIPTNKPNKRKDLPDLIYLNQEEKFKAIIADIKECVSRKQPVLVGTISIESSEYLSSRLKRENIAHKVLNAKFHAKEAEIIAEAGRPGAVTIATNMAGRGTDILLGGSLACEKAKIIRDSEEQGDYQQQLDNLTKAWQQRNAEVLAAGGLHIIGTERHESRRIDNQLRGRAGRQGDVGSTRFYLSVRDNLMRIFISDKISSWLDKLSDSDEAITASWITKAVENAQRKVEGHHFDVRKQLLDFDDVANEQRKVIYQQRKELLTANSISKIISNVQEDVIEQLIYKYCPPNSLIENWDLQGLTSVLQKDFAINNTIYINDKQEDLNQEELKQQILAKLAANNKLSQAGLAADKIISIEKSLLLNILDEHWKDHLEQMNYVRQSIHLRGYAQKDPKQEYKQEAFKQFTMMLESIKYTMVTSLAQVVLTDKHTDNLSRDDIDMQYSHSDDNVVDFMQAKHASYNSNKVGRNAPCPCGSGKKFKVCHGMLNGFNKHEQ